VSSALRGQRSAVHVISRSGRGLVGTWPATRHRLGAHDADPSGLTEGRSLVRIHRSDLAGRKQGRQLLRARNDRIHRGTRDARAGRNSSVLAFAGALSLRLQDGPTLPGRVGAFRSLPARSARDPARLRGPSRAGTHRRCDRAGRPSSRRVLLPRQPAVNANRRAFALSGDAARQSAEVASTRSSFIRSVPVSGAWVPAARDDCARAECVSPRLPGSS
jgi:hypothetical protein